MLDQGDGLVVGDETEVAAKALRTEGYDGDAQLGAAEAAAGR